MGLFRLFILSIAVNPAMLDMQDDYKVKVERLALEFVNNSYIESFKIIEYFYTPFEKRHNVSFCTKDDIHGSKLMESVEAYKFQSNEYVPYPMTYEHNACDAFTNSIYGTKENLEMFDHNLTLLDHCHLKKGCYFINGIFVDDSKYPPYAPRGRYMLDYKLFYNTSVHLVNAKFYIEIQAIDSLEAVL